MYLYPKNKGFFNLNRYMKKLFAKKLNNTVKKLKTSIKPVFLLVVITVFSFPNASVSKSIYANRVIGPVPEVAISAYYNGATLPEIPKRDPRRTMYIVVTAYNSEVGQTDDTPFITAFNTHVRDGIVATNFLPKGTIVRFPEVYGDKEFVVEDRMNKRYYYHMDIWMEKKSEAVNFGSKFLKMEIL